MPFQDESARPLPLAFRARISRAAAVGIAALLANGCATGPFARKQVEHSERAGQVDEMGALREQLSDMRAALTASQARIESLETKLGALGERVSSTQNGIDNLLANHKALPVGVSPPLSGEAGVPPEAPPAESDPEAGFAADSAIQAYRKGAIFHAAGKFPEAVLAFSAFLERHPDHPLAGSAQYYVGDSYFQQKEYKLALSELERVLTSYDRSPRVADTLRAMAEAEDKLKRPERAARHRQLLTSLFPQSPAAALLGTGPQPGKKAENGAANETAWEPKAPEPTAANAASSSALDSPPGAPVAAPPTAPATAPPTAPMEQP